MEDYLCEGHIEDYSCEDHMEDNIHVRTRLKNCFHEWTTWKTGFIRGPHGSTIIIYEVHMKGCSHVRTLSKTVFMRGP